MNPSDGDSRTDGTYRNFFHGGFPRMMELQAHRQAARSSSYCGCITSSTTTLPPLSAVMTLCTGAYPLSVMSST